MKRFVLLAALAVVLGGVGQAGAAPVLSFDENTGINATNQNQTVGWRFTVNTAITVTGLGWWAPSGGPVAIAHEVGLWNPAGTLLADVTVQAGTVNPLDGQFRTVAIAPIVLLPGVNYVVGGQNSGLNTDRLPENVTQSADPRITYGHPTFANLGLFQEPTQDSSATTGFYGPSFSVVANVDAPEPATLTLLGIGIAGLAGYGWRKRKVATP